MILAFVALLVTGGLAPTVSSLMRRLGWLDVPNHRSSHSVPVPRGGGLACLAGVLVAWVVGAVGDVDVPWTSVAACVALALLGFADDRLTLPAAPRLAGQCVAGSVIGAGVAGWPGLLLGLVVTAAVVNVVNFMDGINGITALTMAVWGVVAFLAGRHEGLPALWVLGGVTAGAALGFLPWNAPVARLFLGDVGSYLFGGLVAAGVLTAWAHDARLALLVCAPLVLYGLDTAWALVRRARRGEKLTDAHREHVYQQLTSVGGLPHLAVAAFTAALSAGVALAWWRLPVGLALAATVLVCAVYLTSPRAVGHAAHTRTR
ncbi:glycosyl transferase [Pedococcus bigeumensis]|uniref:Glycosyl transferase n=1 Tax=Pedococcus bigeumensis TaxID=433644 RepID=A0A502CS54_9MICO|nr:glycosyl transferase [Pedococcus bigeumensis]TPG16057.1 glycosyl transferase [Pedococcus bigeumensis]